MTNIAINDFRSNYSNLYPHNINWIQLPLKGNEIAETKQNKYLIVETRVGPLYSNIDLIRRRCLGIAIPLCLGAITFIITSLFTHSPLLKIVTLISSITIPFFFSFVRGLFFQKIEMCSIGIEMDATKKDLLTLFGQKMIEALGGFDAVSQLQEDWDGSGIQMQTGIEYCLDQLNNVIIGFSFLCYNEAKNQYEKKTARIRKNKEGWEILESNGFIRYIKFNGEMSRNNIIEHNTPEEKELLERITRFTNRKALSSFDRICLTENEFLPREGETNIYMLDCPYDDLTHVNQELHNLYDIKFD